MAYLGNSPLNRLYSTQAIALAQGQTTVNVNYTPGMVLFFKNGALLDPGTDYTATNGSVITLTKAASAGDVLRWINLSQFAVANALPLSGGTLTGPLTGPASASEANAGLVRLATAALAQGLTDDATVLTPKTAGIITDLRGISITQSATFTKATNNVQSTGIVAALGLETGDVIEVSGAGTANDGLRTVDTIPDPDNIVLNYAHRNGAGQMSLADQTVSVSIKLVCKWYSASASLGRAWVNVLSSRAANTTYTNSSPREMFIDVNLSIANGWDATLSINGVVFTVVGNLGSGPTTASFGATPIPTGATYSYTYRGTSSATNFMELR